MVVDQRTDFSALQADLSAKRQDRILLYCFELLHLDDDLRSEPLRERKRMLHDLLAKAGPPLIFSDHMDDGAAMLAGTEKLNWEGIVSKRANAPYRSGDQSDSWQEIKTSMRGSFPIVGYLPAMGGIAALQLARKEGKTLRYIGKVGPASR